MTNRPCVCVMNHAGNQTAIPLRRETTALCLWQTEGREYLCRESERVRERERETRETRAMDDGQQQLDILRNFSDVQFHGVHLTVCV